MIQNYKCNEIKIKYSEFSHTIDATLLKILSGLSHALIAKCFRSEISLDPPYVGADFTEYQWRRCRTMIGEKPKRPDCILCVFKAYSAAKNISTSHD